MEKWEDEWIEEARRLTEEEFKANYEGKFTAPDIQEVPEVRPVCSNKLIPIFCSHIHAAV